MIKKLEEIFPALPRELEGDELFEALVKDEKSFKGGIAVSSGCVSCNNGSGCTAAYSQAERKDYE